MHLLLPSGCESLLENPLVPGPLLLFRGAPPETAVDYLLIVSMFHYMNNHDLFSLQVIFEFVDIPYETSIIYDKD